MKLAGVDGCSTGWVVASWHNGGNSSAVTVHLAKTFKEVIDAGYQVIAVDIPIGLPDRGARDCDPAARKLLGPRRNSVFPAPTCGYLGPGVTTSTTRWRLCGRRRGLQ